MSQDRITLAVPEDLKCRIHRMAEVTGFQQSALILMAAHSFVSYYSDKQSFTYSDLFILNEKVKGDSKLPTHTLTVKLPKHLGERLAEIATEGIHFKLKPTQLIFISLYNLVENFEQSGTASFLHLISPDYRSSIVLYPSTIQQDFPHPDNLSLSKTKQGTIEMNTFPDSNYCAITDMVELLNSMLKGRYQDNYKSIAQLLLPLSHEERKDIIQAMSQSRLIKKPVAWTRSAIDRKFKPEKVTSEIPSWVINQTQVPTSTSHQELDYSKKKEALDLLKQLGEIGEEEYRRRYKEIYEDTKNRR